MSSLTLRKALSVLAKSSSFSVTTLTNRRRDVFDDLKQQLFVEQKIESDLKKCLAALNNREIVFLCGSSGDGKSEILTRCYERYQHKCDFHLDATHSFAPYQSAIETLDKLFDTHKEGARPLVLGINTGMLANFSMEGSERHHDVRAAIDYFLDGEFNVQTPRHIGGFYFLDFEHYPKFQFNEDKNYSYFAKALITQLTEPDEKNLFYFIANNDEQAGHDLRVVANFKLLSIPSVQDVIIAQLFKTRLMKDQFVTTRALLDLLHHLLLGPGYLFDNLFVGEENELVQRIADFDPASLHTYELDQFVLRYELGLLDPKLDEFLVTLSQQHIHFDRHQAKQGDAASLIRLFSLLRADDFGNNYQQKFVPIFQETLLEKYAHIWHLHANYTGDHAQKMELRRFYSLELMAAIQRYANRRAPELTTNKDELFLGVFGSVKVTAPVALKGDYDAILKKNVTKPAYFDAYLKIADHPLKPISINLNLFELLSKLNNGYRPNKYDKNAIVLLDEIVEQITEQAKSSSSLKFYDGRRTYIAKEDDGMITISGMNGVA
ncbi:DNA phosphorothioation-dependent restriction protein DptF [Xenorhabdus bovienii]|uniref:DNA phosphorothioation-dependent restriction protein DptF n=1 Tax=Xenorhabdus bovienii TaxID=40576 RepID=UPI0023B2405A|nr:DNA phosphorothioation-dependent restriction protein DptF [Xenorhabdus bovienii]MDE9432682.1 DNA phosphorothioation-dependent restriction protein DptF [Xenorhabdus bovienii]MDE9490458.1 DNA phosphorothioation-dependent restriction protein DptF [Xenorhabdus bovienii]MDE9506734.1 DNA phosphorothioation-dependent restriction protein DptF [Xenorhabdus bovienii]MDE9547252.1 DNA phosphorothioation-dependent restriction protein DptF [Xenorhabdus bovienii]